MQDPPHVHEALRFVGVGRFREVVEAEAQKHRLLRRGAERVDPLRERPLAPVARVRRGDALGAGDTEAKAALDKATAEAVEAVAGVQEMAAQCQQLEEAIAAIRGNKDLPRPPYPTLPNMNAPAPMSAKVAAVQAYIEKLSYNFTGVNYFDVRKHRPMGRILEIKEYLVKLSGFKFINFDDILVDLKLIPETLELPVPRYFVDERQKDLELREKLVKTLIAARDADAEEEADDNAVQVFLIMMMGTNSSTQPRPCYAAVYLQCNT